MSKQASMVCGAVIFAFAGDTALGAQAQNGSAQEFVQKYRQMQARLVRMQQQPDGTRPAMQAVRAIAQQMNSPMPPSGFSPLCESMDGLHKLLEAAQAKKSERTAFWAPEPMTANQ